MKYLVKLELKKPEIRSDYRRTLISFFKKSISSYMDGYFYKELYKNGTKRKSFVWSISFQRPVFNGKIIKLAGSEINMTLKFQEPQTALIYYSSLLMMKDKPFPVGDDNALSLYFNQNEIGTDNLNRLLGFSAGVFERDNGRLCRIQDIVSYMLKAPLQRK
mgnify:CR=1 FL=1